MIVGVKIVFRVGLVLLKQMLGSVDKLREVQGMYETMERLRNISPDAIREDVLVQEVRLFLFLIVNTTRYSTYESLFPPVVTSSFCLAQIIMLPVTEALIERECTVQVRKWRESRGELTHQPGRRLHGTRAVYEYKRRAAAISSGGSFSFLGSSVPPPGPLRSSSSLLSLPGFRKSRAPFQVQKKGSFSGLSGTEARMQQSPPAMTPNQGRGPNHKPPIPPAAGQKAPALQSPLIRTAAAPSRGPPTPAEGQPAAAAPSASALSPSPKIVSEQITPTIPSPTANNSPLPPFPDPKRDGAPVADAPMGEEEVKKKKRSKEDKKKEKEDERKKLKEKKEKEKAEKERLKKEKERLEKEKKKGGKKKDRGGGGETEDKNGAAAAKDSA